MAKGKFLLGMLAMVLVLGMAVIGCGDNGSSGTNVLSLNKYSTTDPSATILEAYGLDLTNYNIIKNSGSANYLGWVVDDWDDFVMVWTSSVVADFTSVANSLDNLSGFNEIYRDSKADEEGLYEAYGMNYDLTLFTRRLSLSYGGSGYYFPAGTLMLEISED